MSLPPDGSVRLQGHVGEQGVPRQGCHRIGIGPAVGARRDAKISRLRVDGPQPPIRSRPHPRNVITHRPNLPTAEPGGWYQHGKIGLAAGAGERRRHVGLFPGRGFHPENQHVFGEPSLLAPQPGSNAKREALFPQQHVAAVTRADGNDFVILRKMADEAPGGIQIEQAMKAAVEIGTIPQLTAGHFTHPGHDPHVQHHIDGVRDLVPHLGQGGS